MNKKTYQELVKEKSPASPIWKNMLCAFLIGGLICTIGQILILLYQHWGAEKELASNLGSVSLVFLASLLTGLNVFDNIAKHAGAGTLVPITGFSNAVTSPAMEFRAEGLVLGVGAKVFTVAGPVILYGVASSTVAGLIYYFFR